MRISLIGLDGRVRVVQADEVKFLPDGFGPADARSERLDNITGPVAVVYCCKKASRTRAVLTPPQEGGFDEAEAHLLQNGWLDMKPWAVVAESHV